MIGQKQLRRRHVAQALILIAKKVDRFTWAAECPVGFVPLDAARAPRQRSGHTGR